MDSLREELKVWDALSDEALSKFTEMLYSDSVFIQEEKERCSYKLWDKILIKDIYYGIKEKL